MLRLRLGQKEPARLGSTICYGQTWATKSHQNSAARFVTAKPVPEKATETRQYDLFRPNMGQKEPPRLDSTICYQMWARKSHRDSAVRLVTAKRGPQRATETRQYDLFRPRVVQKSHRDWAVRFVTAKRGPERATETHDLFRPRVGQKKPPRLGSKICYGQTWARKSHRDSAVRFVTAKRGQYDLLKPNVGQNEQSRLGNTICYCQICARKSNRDSAVRFVTAKRGPERAAETRQYDLLRPNVGQKEPPRFCSTICYGQEWIGQKEPPAKSWPERATETRQYDLFQPRVGQKEPPRLGSTICYGQNRDRKSHRDSAVRFVTANERATRLGSTICYGQTLVGQKQPPRLGSTICYG